MRPVNDNNSTLKTPLNDILGFQANVRLLRCLIDAGSAMSHSELADRTGLSLPGIHKVVPRMMKTGIVQYKGSGKQQQVELRKGHPMAEAVVRLFRTEKTYFNSLIKRLKEEIQALEMKPKSAWVFGKVAQGTDEYGDPIRIALLGDVKSIDAQTDTFRIWLNLSNIELDCDVTIEVRGVTGADLEFRSELMEGEIILLWGTDPKSFLKSYDEESYKQKTHQDLDAQSLADAKVWSALLKKYPEIVPRTIDHLGGRISQITSGEKKELQEWKHILENMSYQRLKKLLESDSERSTRLRQSLPFWEVLNESERKELDNLNWRKRYNDKGTIRTRSL